MDFNVPKEFDDPRYSVIKRKFQLEEWTLIIPKSTVILPSLMVLLLVAFVPRPLLFFLDVNSAIVYIPSVHHEFDLNMKFKPFFLVSRGDSRNVLFHR